MDILNWIYLKKHKLLKESVQNPKDLVILGSNVGIEKRGDVYQSYAVPFDKFSESVATSGCLVPEVTIDSTNTIDSSLMHYTKVGNIINLAIEFTITYDSSTVADTIEILLPANLQPTSAILNSQSIKSLQCPGILALYPFASGFTYFSDFTVKFNGQEKITVLISSGSDDHPFRSNPTYTYTAYISYPYNPSIC